MSLSAVLADLKAYRNAPPVRFPKAVQYCVPHPMPQLVAILAAELCSKHGIDTGALMGSTRLPKVVGVRCELYWILRQRGHTYQQIGRWVGRHHTTVIEGVRNHEARRYGRNQ
jgi:hypothetical protein